MLSDQELHDDLEQRVERFGKTHPISEVIKINKVDTIQILGTFEDDMNKSSTYICTRQETCKCKDKVKCSCDDDNYTAIKSIKSDILSNCKYALEFELSEPTALQKNSKLLRVFTINEKNKDDERAIADVYINRRELKLLWSRVGNSITFKLDEKPTVKYGKLSLHVNYMDFI